MRVTAPSTILLSSLLVTGSVSAFRARDVYSDSLYARDYDSYYGLQARDAYAYAEPEAYDDDFSLYAREAYAYPAPEAHDDGFSLDARDAEPDLELQARDAYINGYLAGLAKRDLWVRAPGNGASKKDDRPQWQKDMDGWENDKDRKKKQKDLDKYVQDQQKKADKEDKKKKKKDKK